MGNWLFLMSICLHIREALQKPFSTKTVRMNRAAQDTKRYRDGYPGKRDDPTASLNLRFYSGRMKLPGYPHNIDQIHRQWWRNWDMLESGHDYIQWLFPIRESSMFNNEAQELMLHEAKALCESPECMARLRKSYEMMLDFYGLKLVDATTGDVARHDDYRVCYQNLEQMSHNLLRITRILKCLGELGHEHYKKPFVLHVLKEMYEHGELLATEESCLSYWVDLLRSDAERQQLREYILSNRKRRPSEL